MRKQDVQIGHIYYVKVSGNVVPVTLVRECPYGGWFGRNIKTNREIRIRTAGRLRSEVTNKATQIIPVKMESPLDYVGRGNDNYMDSDQFDGLSNH